MFVGELFGARDFSPDYVHRDFGIEVLCSENNQFTLSGSSLKLWDTCVWKKPMVPVEFA